MFLLKGTILIKVTNQISQEVEVTEENEHVFDELKPGSCMCAYSFLCDDA